jgi:hypothetical protein
MQRLSALADNSPEKTFEQFTKHPAFARGSVVRHKTCLGKL